MTQIKCTDWHCRANFSGVCSKDEIQLARSMLNSVGGVFPTDDLFRCMSKEPYPKEEPKSGNDLLDKVLDGVWEYLGITKEELEKHVLGVCIKCGSTAKYRDGRLCLAHTRGYHKWRNTRERKRLERVKAEKGIT